MPYYRVFASKPEPPDLIALPVACRLSGDDSGWFQARFPLPSGLIEVNRWLPAEDGIRVELNTWAAWVETNADTELSWVMHRLVTTAQLFSWDMDPSHADAVAFSETLCRFLCTTTDAIYQFDGKGLFTADGTLLVGETP